MAAGRDDLLSPSGLTWLARLPERRGIATQYDTHYDAQACWDSHLAPSALHGVTTVVMGNCGVGFAPCRPADRDKLVELMEGVEDIPGAAMHEGLEWQWESDFDPPRVEHDLPAGGARLMQGARGYRCTVVAGRVTYRDGQPTGELPGKLVRGMRA